MHNTLEALNRIDEAIDRHALRRDHDAEAFDDWLDELALGGYTAVDFATSPEVR